MRHGILFFSLLVLIAGASGGIFVLVNQDGPSETSSLVIGGGLVAPEEESQKQLIEPERPVPAPAPTSVTEPSPSPPPPPAEKININTANYEELQEITGVGPAIAQRIIDYRSQNGQFQKIEDLKNVSGIGDVTFEKMKDEITV